MAKFTLTISGETIDDLRSAAGQFARGKDGPATAAEAEGPAPSPKAAAPKEAAPKAAKKAAALPDRDTVVKGLSAVYGTSSEAADAIGEFKSKHKIAKLRDMTDEALVEADALLKKLQASAANDDENGEP